MIIRCHFDHDADSYKYRVKVNCYHNQVKNMGKCMHLGNFYHKVKYFKGNLVHCIFFMLKVSILKSKMFRMNCINLLIISYLDPFDI